MTKPKPPKKKPKRTERPFTPGNPDAMLLDDVFPKCGVGKETQIDIHAALQLFDIAPAGSGVDFPELAKLTRALNAVFRKGARPALNSRRRESGLKSLEITLALVKGQLYITYARPTRRRRGS